MIMLINIKYKWKNCRHKSLLIKLAKWCAQGWENLLTVKNKYNSHKKFDQWIL